MLHCFHFTVHFLTLFKVSHFWRPIKLWDIYLSALSQSLTYISGLYDNHHHHLIALRCLSLVVCQVAAGSVTQVTFANAWSICFSNFAIFMAKEAFTGIILQTLNLALLLILLYWNKYSDQWHFDIFYIGICVKMRRAGGRYYPGSPPLNLSCKTSNCVMTKIMRRLEADRQHGEGGFCSNRPSEPSSPKLM